MRCRQGAGESQHIVALVKDQLENGMETRRIDEPPDAVFLFMKAIGGIVQFVSCGEDTRISIRFDFNTALEPAVAACIRDLQAKGFYETGRHST